MDLSTHCFSAVVICMCKSHSVKFTPNILYKGHVTNKKKMKTEYLTENSELQSQTKLPFSSQDISLETNTSIWL